MSSVFQQAKQTVAGEVKRVRWTLGLNGVASIALGVVIVVWPGISLYSLVIVFGVYAIARGVFGLVAAFSGPIQGSNRGWLIVSSLAGIAVGVIVFLHTDMSALALLYVIGAYAIALGIITIGGAFWLPLETGDRVLLTLTGFVSILFGIVMFAKPGDGALALLALIAAYAIIFGFIELTVAIGGESLLERAVRSMTATNKPQTSH
jgi:uncharacterized membrane protein HdeD (DUF308 family)